MKRLCLSLCLAAIVAGCSQSDGKVHLRYMAWGNPEQLELEQRIVDEFNKRNPDVVVQLFKVPSTAYRNKMIMMFASRTAPDVVRVDHYDFPQLADRNYFHELDSFIAKDKDFHYKDFFPLAIEECKFEGKMLGLNVLFGGGIMFYNKDLLKKEGLEEPYTLWKRGEWTYDKLLEYAVKTTKYDKDGRPLQFGVNMPPSPFYLGTIQAFGGKFLNDDLSKCVVDSPEAIQAMQFLGDLRWKYKCCPTPAQGANAAFNFESGKLAMAFDYVGMTARYRQVITRYDWDICPMPNGPKGDSLFVKGNQLVMNQETKYPDASWRLMRFITGPIAEHILYVEARRQSPTRVALAFSNEYLHPDRPPHNMDSVALTVQKGTKLPIGARWPEVSAVLTPELDNLFAGREKDAGVAMRRTAAAINKLLAEEPGL